MWNAIRGMFGRESHLKCPSDTEMEDVYYESDNEEIESEENSGTEVDQEFGKQFNNSVNCFSKKGETALHIAVRKGNEKLLVEQLNLGIYLIDAPTTNLKCSILHYAAQKDNDTFTRHIINAGANVNLQDVKGYTPLHYAVIKNSLPNVVFLLEQEANPFLSTYSSLSSKFSSISSSYPENSTPFHIALRKEPFSLDIIKLLAERSSLNSKDSDGETPFSLAVQHPKADQLTDVLNSMLEKDLKMTDTILHHAVSNNAISVDMFKRILNKVLDTDKNLLDRQNANRETALCCLLEKMVQKPRLETNVFVKIGSLLTSVVQIPDDCEKIDESSKELKESIAKLQRVKLALLLEKKPNPNLYGTSSPLHYAVELEDSDLIHQLNCLGANLNAQNTQKDTPLHLASKLEKASIMKELVALGADVNLRNSQGETVLHIVVLKNNTGLAEFLVASHANVNSQDAKKNTPLVYAATNLEMIKVLAGQGSLDLSSKDGVEIGKKALKKAVLANCIEAAKQLIFIGCDVDVRFDLKERVDKEQDDQKSISSHASSLLSLASSSGIKTGKVKNVEDKTGLISQGDTLLHFSVKANDSDLAKACLEKSPKLVNAANDVGITPPMLAVKFLNAPMANLLYTLGDKIEEFLEGKVKYRTLLQIAAAKQMNEAELRRFFEDPQYRLTGEQQLCQKAYFAKKGRLQPAIASAMVIDPLEPVSSTVASVIAVQGGQ